MKHKKINTADMYVDGSYQRALNKVRVEKMAAEYDVEREGYFTVVERSGKYYVVDGQHRLGARKKAGINGMAHCLVVDANSVAEEASRFLDSNGGRVGVGALDTFRAEVRAKDKVALEIKKVFDDRGIRVLLGRGAGIFSAISAAKAVHRRGNLEDALDVLLEWSNAGGERGGNNDGELLRAISVFLLAKEWQGRVDRRALVSRLASVEHANVKARLKRERRLGSSPDEAAKLVLREIYNEGRRGSARLPHVGRQP